MNSRELFKIFTFVRYFCMTDCGVRAMENRAMLCSDACAPVVCYHPAGSVGMSCHKQSTVHLTDYIP